jgi:GNAT superfamily N-acetyltransferase
MEAAAISIETLTEYREADAIAIGMLGPSLSERFTGSPVPPSQLQAIITSPDAVQFVARYNGTIVGIATVSVTRAAIAGPTAYLGDFVTDSSRQGQGIGTKLWVSVITWCRERGLNLEFTSSSQRSAAHAFYLHHGAIERDTQSFHVEISRS